MSNVKQLQNIVFTAAVCAITSITAQIKFNLGPIPYTMQNVGVILAGLLLPPLYAATSMILYVFLIFIGLPLAAGFTGGPSIVLGYCGGYLFGFIISSFLMSLLTRWYLRYCTRSLDEINRKDFIVLLALSFIAILPTYLLGFIVFYHYALPNTSLYLWSIKVTSWLGFKLHGIVALFIASVLIFIPQDLFMDHVIAIIVAREIARIIKIRGGYI